MSTRGIYQQRRAAIHAARTKLLAELFKPVRIVEDRSDGDVWVDACRGKFKLGLGAHSVGGISALRGRIARVEEHIELALAIVDSLHGPLTTDALFKRARAKLGFKLDNHSKMWTAYHALMDAGIVRFERSPGGGLGGRVTFVEEV